MASHKLFASPYINFNGKTQEAMQFYQSVIGGTLELVAMDDKGMHPAKAGERIMHARLYADGAVILATDGQVEYPATVGNNISVSFIGCEKERMQEIFKKLSEGGKVNMPLNDASWGDMFGSLEDKFGINWMFDVTSKENMESDS